MVPKLEHLEKICSQFSMTWGLICKDCGLILVTGTDAAGNYGKMVRKAAAEAGPQNRTQ